MKGAFDFIYILTTTKPRSIRTVDGVYERVCACFRALSWSRMRAVAVQHRNRRSPFSRTTWNSLQKFTNRLVKYVNSCSSPWLQLHFLQKSCFLVINCIIIVSEGCERHEFMSSEYHAWLFPLQDCVLFDCASLSLSWFVITQICAASFRSWRSVCARRPSGFGRWRTRWPRLKKEPWRTGAATNRK